MDMCGNHNENKEIINMIHSTQQGKVFYYLPFNLMFENKMQIVVMDFEWKYCTESFF